MGKKQKEKKEPEYKPKYGLFSCVGYIYRMLWKYERGLAFTGIITVPLSVVLSALALYTPPAILRVIESTDRFSFIALVILGLMLAKLLFDLANNIISQKIANSEFYVHDRMDYMLEEKERYRDLYLNYDPKVKKIDERSRAAVNNNHVESVHFPMDFADMLGTVLKFILFGSIISMLHPLIIVLLAAGCMVDYAVGLWEGKKNWSERDARNVINKKIGYIAFTLSYNFKYAKDIRLYGMQGSLHERFMYLLKLISVEEKKVERRSLLMAVISFLIVLVRDGAAYAFLIHKAVMGEVDASSFVLYFSAITSMSGFMGSILWMVKRVQEGARQLSDFREAMEIEGKLNCGPGIPVPTAPFSIEFRNVSYQYPQGEKKILDNVSFRIEAGEKIALVGLNGAGKTTLTKMMCGMLLPDTGEVLLDGHTLFEYNRDEMYALFGFVPQDYTILPLSIAKNIASTNNEEEIDRDKLTYCIEVAGLTEKIASLNNGADTPLNRRINRDGIELSGGEAQKLLLARLLYKNPQCIVLDEPTAALDPIAEDRMYRRYNEIAAHATSVFISHRLASTRFCDRIFLLDGANFAEVGTHDELMAMGGKYKELFDIQSKYYKEGVKSDETSEE